jgi:hypothetical protein
MEKLLVTAPPKRITTRQSGKEITRIQPHSITTVSLRKGKVIAVLLVMTKRKVKALCI